MPMPLSEICILMHQAEEMNFIVAALIFSIGCDELRMIIYFATFSGQYGAACKGNTMLPGKCRQEVSLIPSLRR